MIVTKRAEILHKYHIQSPWLDNLLQAVSMEHPRYNIRLKLLQETIAKHKVAFFEQLLVNLGDLDLSGTVWALIDGESGPDTRGMEKEWILNIKY